MARGPSSPQQIPSPQLESVPIDEIIQDDVATAEPDTEVTDIAATMAEEDVGTVLIQEDQKLRGLVTDRGLALAAANQPDLNEMTAENLMAQNLVTGSPEMSVFEALQLLNSSNIRRLPIVDEEGQLVGIVTIDDLLVLLSAELGNVSDVIEAQSPRF